MSALSESLPTIESELEGYSTAALLAVQARLNSGYDTAYDHFLCNYVGEPTYGSPNFPAIARVAFSGTAYNYNNPLNNRSSYTPGGMMLNVRRAQGVIAPDDKMAGVLVATADLQTNTITEWCVTDVQRIGWQGQEISLEAPTAGLHAVPDSEEPLSESEQLARILAKRQRTLATTARLILNPDSRNLFIPPIGPDESLDNITRLVSDVNHLTARLGVDMRLRQSNSAQHLAGILQFNRAA